MSKLLLESVENADMVRHQNQKSFALGAEAMIWLLFLGCLHKSVAHQCLCFG